MSTSRLAPKVTLEDMLQSGQYKSVLKEFKQDPGSRNLLQIAHDAWQCISDDEPFQQHKAALKTQLDRVACDLQYRAPETWIPFGWKKVVDAFNRFVRNVAALLPTPLPKWFQQSLAIMKGGT